MWRGIPLKAKHLTLQGYRASLVQELKEDDPALRIEWAELWLEKV